MFMKMYLSDSILVDVWILSCLNVLILLFVFASEGQILQITYEIKCINIKNNHSFVAIWYN